MFPVKVLLPSINRFVSSAFSKTSDCTSHSQYKLVAVFSLVHSIDESEVKLLIKGCCTDSRLQDQAKCSLQE